MNTMNDKRFVKQHHKTIILIILMMIELNLFFFTERIKSFLVTIKFRF